MEKEPHCLYIYYDECVFEKYMCSFIKSVLDSTDLRIYSCIIVKTKKENMLMKC